MMIFHSSGCVSFIYIYTDGQVVRAGVSVTRNVLSRSGGHVFEARSGRTWGAWYFCPKSYLNQKYLYCSSGCPSCLANVIQMGWAMERASYSFSALLNPSSCSFFVDLHFIHKMFIPTKRSLSKNNVYKHKIFSMVTTCMNIIIKVVNTGTFCCVTQYISTILGQRKNLLPLGKQRT